MNQSLRTRARRQVAGLSSLAAATALIALACASFATFAQSSTQTRASEVAVLRAELAKLRADAAQEQKNLENFDDLDFNVFSNQRWHELGKSHAPDIVVHNPDGKVIRGLPAHVEDLKQIFVFAPDTRVVSHPIRIAKGNWTAVQGEFAGTFSRPMPIGDGKFLEATNKPFKLTMVTIGRWEGGVMKEEWLYWDNQEFMRQIGLAK
jgi:hypothetical protein